MDDSGTTSSSASITLVTPIEDVPGVSRARAQAFRRLGIPSVGHLIFHIPHRHEREEAEGQIKDVDPGQIVSVRGEITATRPQTYGRRPRFEAVLMDDTGRLDVTWFNQTYLKDRIHVGDRIRVQGKTAKGSGSALRLINPRWEKLPDVGDGPDARGARLRPIYPASEDLPSWAIENAVEAALDRALPLIEDHLPDSFRSERALPPLREAYRMMHRPENQAEISDARRRIIYDELLLLQLGVAMKRAYIRRVLHAPPLARTPAIDEHIRARLPFRLTAGQERVINEIAEDLAKPTPANRLIQGDVGAGKTVIALHAMLLAVASKHQAALMAPTELLAEQHLASISEILKGSSVRLALLTGSLSQNERDAALGAIASGEVDLVIGTHALLTESVAFRSLALVVIDEQHRFGVHQRAALREKSSAASPSEVAALSPHVLVMTATPIPRTLSLTVFGDLDVSTLRGLPPGRQPIATRLIHGARTNEVHGYIRTRVEQGDQVFVVVPSIGGVESDSQLRSVHEVARALEEGPLKDRRIAEVHGRLSRDTRAHIMERFRSGKIDVVVATSVVEVGVDVPGATLMVIEQAERFGLAQLHQLRGRVGRGEKPSACLLVTGGGDAPLTPSAEARLSILVESNDGFEIAEKDLEIRGPGELLGTRQSGAAPFRLTEFPRDMELLLLARRDAQAWIERSPLLSALPESLLRSRLLKTHGQSLGLADIA